MYKCTENKGNRMDVDSEDGEITLTIYSKEMMCELVMCLSLSDSEKLKNQIAKT